MANARIFFHRCIQDTQDIGSDDEHMVSRVFFSLNYDGDIFTDLYVDTKQPVGADFETAPLEVGAPQGYKGPFNHDAFRAEVEKYYRGLVGSKGKGFRISGGSARMRNNIFDFPSMAEIEIQSSKGGW